MGKKCAVLFSGGKDSCLALHLAKQQGYEIKYLLSVLPSNFYSFMFHKPYLNLLEKQAEMLDIELVVMKSEGKENEEINDLRELIEKVKSKVDTIIVGGIASSYQGDKIKKICGELGLNFFAPLWGSNAEKIWKELFDNHFKVIITKTICESLGKEWLGEIIDEKRFEDLKKLSKRYGFRLDFEGGEAETAVLFIPEFKKDIKIKFTIKSERK